MGNYHPHGDSAIYDTLVRMAQDFSMRYPLVDGQGNFGSIDDDPAAAMRYTEARLTRIALEMLRDLDMDTVDFVPNYDGSKREPLVLPARFPNLLVNGSSGIAVGMATNIPPHNLREVIDAVIAYIDDPSITVEELMRDHIQGPDFPTGGIILGRSGIRDAYETGRGRVRVRAKAHIEEIGRGKEAIIVTELPFMVKKGGDGGLITKIAELVIDKKIAGIANLEDHSDRRGMRARHRAQARRRPEVVLNQLYKHTPMQTTFGVNMVALVDGVPRTLLAARVPPPLRPAPARGRRAPGEVRARPARAPGPHPRGPAHRARQPRRGHRAHPRLARPRHRARAARRALRAHRDPGLGDPRPAPLAAHRARGRRDPHASTPTRSSASASCATLLGDEAARPRPHQGGAQRDRRALRRRAAHAIAPSEDEIDIEDLIADQQMVITITKSGYIKSLPLATYRQQHRGGVGVTGMDIKEGDYIEHLFVCSTHDYLLFFSNRGKVYRSKVYELPEMRAHRARAARWSTSCRCARASGSSPCSPRATSPRASTSCSRRARAS